VGRVRAGKVRWARARASAPLVLVLSHYLALDQAGRIGLLGLGTALWYFTSCTVMLTAPLSTRAATGASRTGSQHFDAQRRLAA
jgi:hypothetical protein